MIGDLGPVPEPEAAARAADSAIAAVTTMR
jgi:hypothetical protein